MMIIMMMMMIIIALKDASRDFYNLLTALSPTLKWPGCNRVQITCNTSNAYHVQHVYHVVRRDSSAVKLDSVEIAFILALFY